MNKIIIPIFIILTIFACSNKVVLPPSVIVVGKIDNECFKVVNPKAVLKYIPCDDILIKKHLK